MIGKLKTESCIHRGEEGEKIGVDEGEGFGCWTEAKGLLC